MTFPTYPSFADTSGFEFVGQVPVQGRAEPGTAADGSKVLRVTYPEVFASGSAFWRSPIGTVDGNGAPLGFSTQFQFRDAGQGDGFTFAMTSDPRSLGGFRGYQYLNNGVIYNPSVAVGFSTVQLQQPGNVVDAGANDVQILTGGSFAAPLADSVVPGAFWDGRLWTAWVTYDGPTHLLSVWASPDGFKPAAPTATATIDIAATIGSQLYAGFTASNGYSSSSVDIYNWHSDGGSTAVSAPKIDGSTPTPINEGSTVTLDGSASRPGPADTSAASGWDASSGALPQNSCAQFLLTNSNDPGVISGGVLKTGDPFPNKVSWYRHIMFAGDARPTLRAVPKLVMETSVRIENSVTTDPNQTAAQIQFIGHGGFTNQLSIGNNEVFLWDAMNHRGPTVQVDTTSSFHRYRIEADNTTNVVSVFYDGALVLTGAMFLNPAWSSIVVYAQFGSLTSAAGGVTDWQYFHFNALNLVCPHALSYQWHQVSGPPVVLSSDTAVRPSFRAIDDGDYSFELAVNDTVSTGVADVTAHVNNVAPTVTKLSADATATDGLAEITAVVSDPGLFDTQRLVVDDWGDGTAVQTVAANAGGTGWAYAQLGHRYIATGTKTVRVHAVDNANVSSPVVSTTISGPRVATRR